MGSPFHPRQLAHDLRWVEAQHLAQLDNLDVFVSQKSRPSEAKEVGKSMRMSSLALMLKSLMIVLVALPTTLNAQDLLQSTLERMQNGLDQLIGDGVFDSADEDMCLSVLGNSANLKQDVMLGAVEGDLSDVMARGRLHSLATIALDERMLWFFLRDTIEEKREVPPFETLSQDETERLSLACSTIVKNWLEDTSAEVALRARSRAELWVLLELIAALEERSNR